MKKIVVNKDTCIGCGACIAIDDAHFDFDEVGKSEVISQENLEDKNLLNAIESCPVVAITIKENIFDTCDANCDCGCKDDVKKCNCDDNCGCKDDVNEYECICDDNCDCCCKDDVNE